MKSQIVGWGTLEDEKCIKCRKESHCYISYNGMEMEPICNNCVPKGIEDKVADVFVKVSKGLRND